jgi:signal transduction histidine kinase
MEPLRSHPPAQRSLARQLALELGGLALLILALLAAIAYYSASGLVADEVPRLLQSTVRLRAQQQGLVFSQAQASVARLKGEWLRRADAQDARDADARFHALFARSSDGVWRVRPELTDTERAPTFYLQHGESGPDGALRIRAVVSYELLREQGPALTPPFFSAYMDFVEKGLMVFSRGVDWGRSATPQTDNYDYPTMTGSDPRHNPSRQAFWTPVYFDSEAKAWMVSVIEPLDWRKRWVGTVGHDITIDRLLDSVSADSVPDSLSMIVSRDGQLIAHPQLRARIAEAQGQLSLAQLHDPLLDAIYALASSASDDAPQVARTPDGRYWVAWARIGGPQWWSVAVIPQSQIDARLRTSLFWVVTAGLACIALVGWLAHRILRRRVGEPLSHITAAVESLGRGESPAAMQLKAAADLELLAQSFDTMSAQLAAQRAVEQAHAQTLEHEIEIRREAEAKVRELNQSLEERVRRRGEELQRAQQELVQQETLAGLGSLVAGVSHELNTPLGNALIAADTALSAVQQARFQLDGAAVRRSELVAAMERSIEAMRLTVGNLRRSADLVQDFKQVALDRSSLQRRRFDLREVAVEVVGLLRLSIKPRPIAVEVLVPEGITLDSYPGPFGQVLTNLVQNAIVHAFGTDQPGRVTVALESLGDGVVTLSVSDDGQGIPPELHARVFQPFFTTRLGQGGSGLGLHIVYSVVVTVLGGRVSLSSVPGRGSRFIIELPLIAPAEADAKAGAT